ncbi:MAG: SPOR domain-containing protein [Proteobacteria bacterium]|nr:SPOR domain-containing protein [Pseudomonadota bacterium]
MPADVEPKFSVTKLREIYDKERRAMLKRRTLTAFVVAVALGGFSAIVWYSFTKDQDAGADSLVPLIKAENTPIKVRPEKPGGMEVPNQDKLVYSRMNPGELPPPVEKLLPLPEVPVAKPVAPPEDGSAGNAKKLAEAAPTAPTAPMAEEPAAAKDTAKSAPAPPAPKIAGREKATNEAAMAKAGAELAIIAPALGGYAIQLVALRSRDRAEEHWRQLQKAHGDILGNLTHKVVTADLGDRGTFYRLRAGRLPDRAAAERLCAKLAARKIGCLVVKP